MRRELRPEPLTAERFAPFGQVVQVGVGPSSAANQGTAARYDFVARLASSRPLARPNLAVFQSKPVVLPRQVELLERHPCSSQAFVPMRGERYLVMVAPALDSGAPDLDALRVFEGHLGQGINYDVGVWHHPILALGAPADLVMLAWEDGSALDCVEYRLPRGGGEPEVWVV